MFLIFSTQKTGNKSLKIYPFPVRMVPKGTYQSGKGRFERSGSFRDETYGGVKMCDVPYGIVSYRDETYGNVSY